LRVLARATAMFFLSVAIDDATWRSGLTGGASGSWTIWKVRRLAKQAGRGGKSRSFADQEAVGGDAERGMMLESPPASPLVMGEAEFGFELLIIALDAPAEIDDIDERRQADFGRQGREKVFAGPGLALWPFDQEPFDGVRRRALPIARGRTNAQGAKARRERRDRALAPGARDKTFQRQAQGQFLDGDRRVTGVAAQSRRWTPAPASWFG